MDTYGANCEAVSGADLILLPNRLKLSMVPAIRLWPNLGTARVSCGYQDTALCPARLVSDV